MNERLQFSTDPLALMKVPHRAMQIGTMMTTIGATSAELKSLQSRAKTPSVSSWGTEANTPAACTHAALDPPKTPHRTQRTFMSGLGRLKHNHAGSGFKLCP